MTTKENTPEVIDFEKDYQTHLQELASEIAGLHNDLNSFSDDFYTLESFVLGVEDSDRW